MKLHDYLKEQNIPITSFANSVGVRRQAIHSYISGEKYPSPKTLKRIVEITNGEVMPNDFYDLPHNGLPQ